MGARRLSEQGKEKLRAFVARAATLEDLADVEVALDGGVPSARLAAKLRFVEFDFEAEEWPLPAPASAPAPAPAAVAPDDALEEGADGETPLGVLALMPSGLEKVRRTIETATSETLLSALDQALIAGDIPSLKAMLRLQPEDLQPGMFDEEPVEGELTEGSSSTEASEAEDEYDPFATAPAPALGAAAPPTGQPKRPRRARAAPAEGGLGALQGDYGGSSSSDEETGTAVSSKTPAGKRRKPEPVKRKLAWPVSWAWLMTRSTKHADFRPPEPAADWVYASPPGDGDSREGPTAVALSTSLVYVGDGSAGYDVQHLGRVVLVDDHGEVLVDVLVKPRQPLLDSRTQLTGLTRAMLEGPLAVDYAEARRMLLRFLRPETLLVGYRLTSDLEAAKLWHRPLIDVALLFEVESAKKHAYHPLRWIVEKLLREVIDDDKPHDALETARLIMRLAQYEANKAIATPAFAPRPERGCELLVRHIPHEWGDKAQGVVARICSGAAQGFAVRWLLSETDPSDWRGEAVLTFPSVALRDASFAAATAMTDIHIQWQDAPGAPPLGAFLTEQSLVQAFSGYGIVVSARIPRKPLTREPQSFAFVSFLHKDEAERVAKMPEVEVEIAASWKLPLRPRLAKFGHITDKRVAVRSDPSSDDSYAAWDWVHLCKR